MAFCKLNSALSSDVKSTWILTALFRGLKEVLEFNQVQVLPRHSNPWSHDASGSVVVQPCELCCKENCIASQPSRREQSSAGASDRSAPCCRRNWDSVCVAWLGLVLGCQQLYMGPISLTASLCYLKAKLVVLLNLDSEGGIGLLHASLRAPVPLGLEVSSGAHVKKHFKLCGPVGKG